MTGISVRTVAHYPHRAPSGLFLFYILPCRSELRTIGGPSVHLNFPSSSLLFPLPLPLPLPLPSRMSPMTIFSLSVMLGCDSNHPRIAESLPSLLATFRLCRASNTLISCRIRSRSAAANLASSRLAAAMFSAFSFSSSIHFRRYIMMAFVWSCLVTTPSTRSRRRSVLSTTRFMSSRSPASFAKAVAC